MTRKIIHSFPPEEPIVGMIVFDGRLLVASSKQIYELKGEILTPLEIQPAPLDESDF